MKPTVTVVDYGIGNLFSVTKALERVGAEVKVSSAPADVASAQRLVLPGVGAFADGMRGLAERGLIEPIKAYAASGRPFLGICLGMQLMLDSSEEFGNHRGLGLVAGRVTGIPPIGSSGQSHKIPHIGWSELTVPKGKPDWRGTILERIKPGSAMYFVHSFIAEPSDPANRLADCDYDGIAVSAVIQSGALFGCQFHPEKSGAAGIRIVEDFVNWTAQAS